jgi:hypothetical protein
MPTYAYRWGISSIDLYSCWHFCDFRFSDLDFVSLWAIEFGKGLSLLDFDSSGLGMIG